MRTRAGSWRQEVVEDRRRPSAGQRERRRAGNLHLRRAARDDVVEQVPERPADVDRRTAGATVAAGAASAALAARRRLLGLVGATLRELVVLRAALLAHQ